MNRYENNSNYHPHNRENYPHSRDGYYHDNDKVINGESLNVDATLEQISKEIRPGETLILDIGYNNFHQADEVFDTLVMRGYDVRKTFRNGRNQILVYRKM